ncbi:MAG: ECF transporter S component [Clostridium sp. SCN 57-10]|nr:MAG: ECF transporter S component [Clostridium sp. SCN 57-10]
MTDPHSLPGRRAATRRMTKLGMLAAISVVLVALIHFPIFPAADFLEYDPADIPIFIGTFAFGPGAGLVLTAVVCVIQGLTVSVKSGIYGIIMHFLATGSFVLVAGLIYRRGKNIKSALLALTCGVVTMTLVMVAANLVVTPYYTGMPVEAVKGLLLPIIVPFNLVKAAANSLITFLLYKRVSALLHR